MEFTMCLDLLWSDPAVDLHGFEFNRLREVGS